MYILLSLRLIKARAIIFDNKKDNNIVFIF